MFCWSFSSREADSALYSTFFQKCSKAADNLHKRGQCWEIHCNGLCWSLSQGLARQQHLNAGRIYLKYLKKGHRQKEMLKVCLAYEWILSVQFALHFCFLVLRALELVFRAGWVAWCYTSLFSALGRLNILHEDAKNISLHVGPLFSPHALFLLLHSG